MNRLTRPINSLDTILFSSPRNRLLNSQLSRHSHTDLNLQFTRQLFPITLSLSCDHRRRMDSNSPANLSSSALDDFVNVENPGNDGSSTLNNVSETSIITDEETDDSSDDNGGEGNRGEESEGGESDRRSLPQELLNNVVVLSCDNGDGHNCDVYLVGTAHVSQESCREVQAIISCLKPQVVFLELCSSRVSILSLRDLKVPTMAEMIDMWKKKQNVFGILYSYFLAKVGDKLEVLPGSEFRVAFEEAMKYGCKVVLGDRPVQVTIRRTWGMMPLWHKIKLLFSILFQAAFLPSADDLNNMLKEMNDVDMLTLVIQEMSREFPSLMETLMHERDRYMSSTLLRVAREHTSVVAVVGKGHLQGIKRNWKKPVEVNELLEIPTSRPILSVVKVLTAISVAVAGTAIVSGIYLASKKQS